MAIQRFSEPCPNTQVRKQRVSTYSGGTAEFLSDVDFEVGSEERVWLSVYQRDVFALELRDLRNRQIKIVEMLATVVDRVVKEGAEDAGHELRVGRELAQLPWFASEGRQVDARFATEAFFFVQFFILTQLIQAFDNIAAFIAIGVTDLIN